MRNVLLFIVVLLGLAGLAGWGPLGGLRGWFLGEVEESSTPYWCPMDPEIVRPAPGMCPICNMELVPFEGGTAGAEPGVLVLSDRQVQQAGVRLDTARVRDLVREIDATGRLEVNPATRTVVVLRYPGQSRLERVHVHAAGQPLREGDVVAEVRNATMQARLLEYRELLARYAALRREGSEVEAAAVLELSTSIKKTFGMAGMPMRHLDVLAAKPKHLFSDPLFPVIAPASGTVLRDPAFFQGQVLTEGARLLELADLSELWLEVELYEHELPLVEVGQTVEFTTLAVPDKVFRAPVRFIEPIVREHTQTVRARCRVWSADTGLAPGMFVRARVACPVPQALSVPASAVLQSGRRDVVIVSEGGGRFRPRIVEVGRRFLSPAGAGEEPGFGASGARYHEVVSGVSAGERVVVAGNFLLNAEAQFQGVLQKMIEAHQAQADAPRLEEELNMAFGMVLKSYDALRVGFVEDTPDALAEPARELAHHATMAAQRPSPVADSFARMAQAALGIAELAPALPPGQNEEDPGWVRARTAFGALSREVVQYLRDYAPAKVATGELHLFRCPMADDFGFDLWVQPESELANPYMGQWMVECGVPAELE